jgi:DNA-binding protein YbaB
MDETILDPDGARERLAAWKGRIDKLAADTQAMSTQLQEVRVTAKDPAGLAEVTIDSTGVLVDLRLTDRIQRVTPDAVTKAIMATLGEARSKLAERSQEIIAATVGTDSPVGQAIAQSVTRHQHGDRAPERPGDDDEGFDARSILGRR